LTSFCKKKKIKLIKKTVVSQNPKGGNHDATALHLFVVYQAFQENSNQNISQIMGKKEIVNLIQKSFFLQLLILSLEQILKVMTML
jgi:hypothetical protein